MVNSLWRIGGWETWLSRQCCKEGKNTWMLFNNQNKNSRFNFSFLKYYVHTHSYTLFCTKQANLSEIFCLNVILIPGTELIVMAVIVMALIVMACSLKCWLLHCSFMLSLLPHIEKDGMYLALQFVSVG